jgi:hypothetical protein
MLFGKLIFIATIANTPIYHLSPVLAWWWASSGPHIAIPPSLSAAIASPYCLELPRLSLLEEPMMPDFIHDFKLSPASIKRSPTGLHALIYDKIQPYCSKKHAEDGHFYIIICLCWGRDAPALIKRKVEDKKAYDKELREEFEES